MRFRTTLQVAAFMAWRAIVRGNIGVLLLTIAVMGTVFSQLVFVPSLITGAKEQVESQLRDNVTSSITVMPPGTDLVIADPGTFVDEARSTLGVAAVTPTVLAGTQVSYLGRRGSWSTIAVEPTSFADVFTTPSQLVEGRFLEPGANSEIVLGVGIAGADREDEPTFLSSLRTVHVGDEVTVTMLGGGTDVFTVVGIYDIGIGQANQAAFISIGSAEAALPLLAGQISTIYIRTDTVGNEAEVIERLSQYRSDVTYEPWQRLNSAVVELTASFDVVGAILGVVSLIVAVIVVLIVTYIDLVSKRRTIGIERAIGISAAAIVIAYLIKAAVFAVLGAIVGACLFLFAAVPIVDRYPFEFPIGPVTLSTSSAIFIQDAVILIVVAMIGALLPAWRSVRMRLLDAIWG